MEMKSGASTSSDSGAYTDLNRLAALKTGDKNSEGNLRKVAQEFESLFMGEMLKSMRSANDVLAKDNPLNTEATKQYQSMYDQQLAVTMSKNGGIGLQDVLMRQLSKNASTIRPGGNPFAHADSTSLTASGKTATDGTATTTASGNRLLSFAGNASTQGIVRNDMAALNQRRLALPSKLSDRLLAGIVPSSSSDATQTAASLKNRINQPAAFQTHALSKVELSTLQVAATQANNATDNVRSVAQPPLAPSKKSFATADDFVATMLPMAEEAAARIGVDPKVLVAQAALETGWGKSVMRSDSGGNSHNLFGIKATSSWKGDQARAITSEFRDGQMVKETAQFRSYDSYADSFHDLVSTLQNNDRYQGVVKSADNPEQFVKELQKAGYATDPNYASKISAIVKQMQAYQDYARATATGTTTNL